MTDNTTTSTNISLGNPFFVEKGKITGQRLLTVEPQPQVEYTLLADGLMNDNLNVTDTGTITSTIRKDGSFFSIGQGMIMIKEANSEMATWIAYMVGNRTQEGKMASRGAGFYNTHSTGKLAFLRNLMSIFKTEVDEAGNLWVNEWQWK